MGTDLENLVALIASHHDASRRAHRLALSVHPNDPARARLTAMADELDKEIDKLEAQLAVLKQQASEDGAASVLPIAALKPSGDPDDEPEPDAAC